MSPAHRFFHYKSFFFIVALVLVAIGPVFALSQENESGGTVGEVEELKKEIEARRKKITDLEATIETYKKEIAQKKTEAVSLKNQMEILESHTTQVELDIALTNERIETVGLQIEALDLEMNEKESSIERQKEILAEFLRSIYQESDQSLVEILATHDSFSEFYNKLQYLETVEADLVQSTQALRRYKEELTDRRKEKEETKAAFDALKDNLDDQKKDLDEQRSLKQHLFNEAKASEATYQTLVGNLRRQYEEIEGEIKSIEQEMRRRLEKKQGGEDHLEDASSLSWPTNGRYVTAYFHDPDYPYRHIFEHNAIDIRAAQGTPIKAAAGGVVARAKRCSSWRCYSYIMVLHSNGLSTVYGHLSNVQVEVDQFVTRGEIIGYSGGSPGTNGAGPFVTGPHLHFEVRQEGIPVNPLGYLGK